MEDISQCLNILTSIHVNIRLTVVNYQHVAIKLRQQIKGLVIQ